MRLEGGIATGENHVHFNTHIDDESVYINSIDVFEALNKQ